jgi:hypothetical protein
MYLVIPMTKKPNIKTVLRGSMGLRKAKYV